jgi:predicted permease
MNQLVMSVLIWIVGGYALRKTGLVGAQIGLELTQIVLWLTLPPLVFTAVHGTALAGPDWAMPALAWLISLLAIGAGWAIAKMMALPPARTGAWVLALAFGNTTFLGYPIIGGLYPLPSPQLALAILYDQLGTTFAVNTMGATFASLMAGLAPKAGVLVSRIVRFPPLWALVLGLVCKDVALPKGLLAFLQSIGALTIPLMLLSMGTTLRFGQWRQAGALVVLATVIKLLVMPAVVWGIVSACGLPLPHRQAAVLEAAMPTMFYALTLALGFGLEVPLVINAIVLSTLLSFVTLPFWHFVVSGP